MNETLKKLTHSNVIILL